jgi:ribosomal protein S18 acetylase RimI-like enzyme
MNTGLVESYGLSREQLNQIEHLADRCNNSEKLTIKLNWNQLRSRPVNELNDFLFYAGGNLVGYLALYSFNNREVEISAMVDPDHRREGIFSGLLQVGRREINRRKIPDILFICERKSPAVQPTMTSLHAVYEHSEHKMIHTGQTPQQPLQYLPNLSTRPATVEDIQLVAQLDETCFNVPAETATSHLATVLGGQSAHQMSVITLNKQPIGKIQVLPVGQEMFISAFCIWPEHRRKGIGTQVLSQIVAGLLADGWQHISLEVETKNQQALKIYQRAGFDTATTYDYYRLPVTGNEQQ